MAIHYLIGNALEPIKKPAIIPHICNDKGRWKSGFVIAVSNLYPEPEQKYLEWKKQIGHDLPLGHLQFIQVEEDVWVANMIAQHDTRIIDGIPPLRIDALKKCLDTVNDLARVKDATVHAPRIGAVSGKTLRRLLSLL